MDRDVTLIPGDEKSEYYRQGFYTLVYVVNIQVLIILALTAGLLFYTNFNTREDRYLAETIGGRKTQMVGLPLPNMGRQALSAWVASAASQIMTFGFNNIDESFDKSKKNFTALGWESFRKAMISSKLIDDMVKAQQIVTSVPQSVPVLTKEGLVNGRYTWTFELKLLSTFRAGSAKTTRVNKMRIVLERVPTRDNPNAVGIGEWYMY